MTAHMIQEPQDETFRILALDGGGIRGIFTASYLATLEEQHHVRIADHFDLIAGTSTGGIIGLALAFGIPAKQVLDLYLEIGRLVFSNPRRLGMIRRSKYGNGPLARVLREVFGERTINEVLTPVCIMSYELTNSYPRVWKDDHMEDALDGGEAPAWKIALATSSAPIYFPGSTVAPGDSHVDGGLFANNPTLIGVAEAVSAFHQPLERIRLLSVGAGERAERIPYEQASHMGVWQWKTLMYEHMLIAQAHIAHEIARRFLAPGQYERVNVPLEHPYPFDDYEAARTLVEPGARLARTQIPEFRRRYFSARAAIGRRQKAAVAEAVQRRHINGIPHRLGR
jgi:patatin-like phospholipase/acyl hydrolase